jgi:hypothetical protein
MNATIFESNQPWATTLIRLRLLIFNYCHPHHLHHSLLQTVIITIIITIKIIPMCPIAPIIVLIIIRRLAIVAWVVVVAAPSARRLHRRSQIRRCRRQRPRRTSTIRSRRVIRSSPKPTFPSLTHILTFWWISVVVWAFCWWSRRKSIKGIAWALSAIKSGVCYACKLI